MDHTEYEIDARFLKATGTIEKAEFATDRSLALMFHVNDGGPPERLNTNMAATGITTPPDHIWVKTYAEHEGLPEALVTAGICMFAELPDVENDLGAQWILMKVLI